MMVMMDGGKRNYKNGLGLLAWHCQRLISIPSTLNIGLSDSLHLTVLT